MQVAAYLAQQGFQVINVSGGIHAWSQQIDPTIPVY
jgi:rhodanese-related sulfurtransferase